MKKRLHYKPSTNFIFSLFLIAVVSILITAYLVITKPVSITPRASAPKQTTDNTPTCKPNEPNAPGGQCPSGWYCNGNIISGSRYKYTVRQCTQKQSYILSPVEIARDLIANPSTMRFAPALALLFHILPEQIINGGAISNLPLDKKLIINQIVESNGVQSFYNLNIAPAGVIGLSECADSRCVKPSVVWIKTQGAYQLIQSNNIAAQPVLFPAKTPASFFITHVNSCGEAGGCGALGGIKVLLADQTAGISYLKSHHVPQDTIDALIALINKGVTSDASEWAIMGARVQADLNMHPVVAVVNGHADNTFNVIGVVKPFSNGSIETIEKYPLLSEIAQYFHQPLPLDAGLAAGQTPKAVVLNFSKKWNTSQIYGNLQQMPGTVFKVGLSDLKNAQITLDQIDEVAKGAGYGLMALKNGGVSFITADTLEDLQFIRSRLALTMKTNGIDDFLKNSGVIVSALVDSGTGRLGKYVIIETAGTGFGAEKLLLKELSQGRWILPEKAILFLTSSLRKVIELAIRGLGLTDKEVIVISKTTQIFQKSGRLIFGIAGKVADVAMWYQAVDRVKTEIMGLGSTTQGRYIQIKDLVSSKKGKIVTSYSFFIGRKDLVKEHALALFTYNNYGKYGTQEKHEPWSEMEPSDVGKLLNFNFDGRWWAHQFILRTGSPPNLIQGVTEGYFNSEDKNQQIMLVSQEGYVISNNQGTEIHALSFIDRGGPEGVLANTNPKNFYIWKISADKTRDGFVFTLIGKVKLNENNVFENVPLVWNNDF